jgi:hypothetical protein
MNPEVDDPISGLEIAIRGFGRARARFEQHGAGAVPTTVLVPLTEAMWWAVSLYEGIVEVGGTQAYEKISDEPGGRALRGVRFARNRLGHQRAFALQRINGVILPAAPPLRMFEFVWRPAAELPRPGRDDSAGLSCYEERLSGKPARQTLDSCAEWFEACRDRLFAPLGFTWPATA